MSLFIGLTGGLATGKSTVAAMFARRGARVIDADEIVHGLLEPGGSCFKIVVKTFGKQILHRGRIDRKRLACIVFKNIRKLRQLERILHPKAGEVIRKEIKGYRKSKKKEVIILDAPLLFEAGLDREVDYTIVVKAGRKEQLKRVIKRSALTKTEAFERLKAQLPLSVKMRLADIIIDNNSSRKETQKQVKAVWQMLSGRLI